MIAVLMLLAALPFGAGETTPADVSAVETRLTIHAWPNGRGKAPVRQWTLVCPAGGTLPRPRRACRLLEAQRAPFAPVPGNAVCTQIYGGPAMARVRGTFRGRSVASVFSRGDGCQIERWNDVAFLFPGVPRR